MPIKDVVGFAVNRLIHIFWIEAMRLVEEGVATPEDIDTACKLGMGLPVGPFRLMDAVTNNLTLDVQEILHEAYWPALHAAPPAEADGQGGLQWTQRGQGLVSLRRRAVNRGTRPAGPDRGGREMEAAVFRGVGNPLSIEHVDGAGRAPPAIS